jgi:hypothetical protein
LLLWNLSRKDPSFENTLTGFGFGGTLDEAPGREVEGEVAMIGKAYPE